jgi:signal recognition particle receptor subunit beta
MVFFNYATMQMAAKIVYYGPGLCGKTTNLHHIYTKTSPQSRGEMVSLETETDRTLFFDLLPIDVGVIGGFKTRLQLYTVPGQVFYNTTRKLVLKGVDGMVFVADSQKAMIDANVESFHNLRENLAEIGLDLDEIPIVLQLNKRDLPNVATVDHMLDALDPERRFEYVESIASTGVGVFETLKVISKLTLRTLRRRMTGDESAKPAPPARTAQFRVQSNDAPPRTTMAATTPLPSSHSAPIAIETPSFEEIAEIEAQPARPAVPEPAIAPPTFDRRIIADAPVAEVAPFAPPPPAVAPAPAEPEPAPPQLEVTAAAAEPEIDFSQTERPVPHAEAEVKTVKVRSSVDVMAELEALRKRATQTNTKVPKRDPLADLASLARPKRDLQRTLNLHLPPDALARTRSVRVTLSFEDEASGVVETQEQTLDLGDTSGVQSVSVNLKIDQA